MLKSNTHQISINALFLYLRTGISMLLQLIAVRYLLKFLGEEGYGLYGLVGSIVAIVASMKGLLSSSIQRFLNIAIGQKRFQDITDIFNASLLIHISIGLSLAIFTMAIGIILIPSLSIPDDYEKQVVWILVFSALTMGIDIISVPYSAILISYERFSSYAMLSILDSILKLVIVILLIFFPFYRVSVYSGLLFVVAVIMRSTYVLVVRKHFSSIVKVQKINNRKYLKELSVFAGFKGLGTISNAIQNSGLNFILNIFGGLLVNTARTISYQVLTAVNVLVWNINAAFVPRIITLYGENKIKEYTDLVIRMTKFTFAINIVNAFSISLLIDPILKFWLGTIPPFTSGFVILIFFYAISRSFIDSIDAVFSAEGKIRGFQFLLVLCMIITLAISWFFLKLGYSCYWPFIIMSISELLTCLMCYILAYKITSFDVLRLVKEVLLPAGILLVGLTFIGFYIRSFIPSELNIGLLILLFIISVSLCSLCTVRILLTKLELNALLVYFKTIINKFF